MATPREVAKRRREIYGQTGQSVSLEKFGKDLYKRHLTGAYSDLLSPMSEYQAQRDTYEGGGPLTRETFNKAVEEPNPETLWRQAHDDATMALLNEAAARGEEWSPEEQVDHVFDRATDLYVKYMDEGAARPEKMAIRQEHVKGGLITLPETIQYPQKEIQEDRPYKLTNQQLADRALRELELDNFDFQRLLEYSADPTDQLPEDLSDHVKEWFMEQKQIMNYGPPAKVGESTIGKAMHGLDTGSRMARGAFGGALQAFREILASDEPPAEDSAVELPQGTHPALHDGPRMPTDFLEKSAQIIAKAAEGAAAGYYDNNHELDIVRQLGEIRNNNIDAARMVVEAEYPDLDPSSEEFEERVLAEYSDMLAEEPVVGTLLENKELVGLGVSVLFDPLNVLPVGLLTKVLGAAFKAIPGSRHIRRLFSSDKALFDAAEPLGKAGQEMAKEVRFAQSSAANQAGDLQKTLSNLSTKDLNLLAAQRYWVNRNRNDLAVGYLQIADDPKALEKILVETTRADVSEMAIAYPLYTKGEAAQLSSKFKNALQEKNFKELADASPEMAKMLDSYARNIELNANTSYSKVLESYDELMKTLPIRKFQQIWRATTTLPMPAYHTVNAVGAVVINHMALGAARTVYHGTRAGAMYTLDKAAKIAEGIAHYSSLSKSGKLGAFLKRAGAGKLSGVAKNIHNIPIRLKDGNKYALGDIMQAAADAGMFRQASAKRATDFSAEALGEGYEWATKAKGLAKEAVDGDIKLQAARTLGKGAAGLAKGVATGTDDMQHLTAFMGALRGLDRKSIAHAKDFADRVAGNYNNMTATEKMLAKDFFGFYSFNRYAVPRVIEASLERPAAVAFYEKFRVYMEEKHGKNFPVSFEAVPDWLESQGFTSPLDLQPEDLQEIRKLSADLQALRTEEDRTGGKDAAMTIFESPVGMSAFFFPMVENIFKNYEKPDKAEKMTALLGPLVSFGIMQMTGMDENGRPISRTDIANRTLNPAYRASTAMQNVIELYSREDWKTGAMYRLRLAVGRDFQGLDAMIARLFGEEPRSVGIPFTRSYPINPWYEAGTRQEDKTEPFQKSLMRANE